MAVAIETEKKFIIRMPDLALLEKEAQYRISEITQTYFSCPTGVTHRVRKRVFSDKVVYTETKKTRISKMSVIEDERELTEVEYERLLSTTEVIGSLSKTRHIFLFGGHTVEVDVYPLWKRSCVLEVELESETEELTLPSYIEVLEDVTGSRKYSNHNMSLSFPEELI